MEDREAAKRRKRLFAKGRPFIRPFDVEKDLWLLWASYDLGGFTKLERGLDQQQFSEIMLKMIVTFTSIWLIEDDCKWFKAGRGPVCIMGVKTDGWKIEPHMEAFKWATPRSILRCWVIFLQKARFDKSVGVVEAWTIQKYVNVLHHLRKYRVLYYVGKIPNGVPEGDKFIFYIKGSRECITQPQQLMAA